MAAVLTAQLLKMSCPPTTALVPNCCQAVAAGGMFVICVCGKSYSQKG